MTAGALGGIGELSRERFAELFMETGKREGMLVSPRVDMARFVVMDEDREHDLAALYERFLGLPTRSRRYFLVRALRGGALTAEVSWPEYPEVRGRLLPRLRSGAYLDLRRLDDVNRGREPQSRYVHLAGELFVAIVIDGDDAMTAVTGPLLERWGVSFDELCRVAFDNLARVDSEPLSMLSPGFWMGTWEDSYAASRVLLHHTLKVCDEPIVAVPNRDTLLVADRHNAAALGAMVSLIESVAEGAHTLSRTLFRASGGSLHPWTLPSTHPSAVAHRRLAVEERVRRYGEQQWLLQEAAGDTWYVSGVELDESRDGSVTTRALWTEGVSAILPEVDRVHLLSANADGTSSRLLVASFADLADIDGVLIRTEELLPRWRTGRFPSPEELASIAVPVAVDPGTAAVSEPGRRP